MKILAVLCSIASFLFTCMVLVTDGMSGEFVYAVFGVLLLLVPILTVLALAGGGTAEVRRALKPIAAAGNIALLGFIGWAMFDQYPHPQEPGFIPYVALMTFTPILSAFVLVWSAAHDKRREMAV